MIAGRGGAGLLATTALPFPFGTAAGAAGGVAAGGVPAGVAGITTAGAAAGATGTASRATSVCARTEATAPPMAHASAKAHLVDLSVSFAAHLARCMVNAQTSLLPKHRISGRAFPSSATGYI